MPFKKDLNKQEGGNEETQSRINSAGLINSTIEKLWTDCYSALSQGNLVLWNRKLDALWTIFGGDQVEGDDKDEEMNKIDDALYKTGSLNHKKTGFAISDESENTTIALQYLILKKKSLFLRRLQNEQGKGTAYRSNDDYDID